MPNYANKFLLNTRSFTASITKFIPRLCQKNPFKQKEWICKNQGESLIVYRGRSRTAAISKVELFLIIVNG